MLAATLVLITKRPPTSCLGFTSDDERETLFLAMVGGFTAEEIAQFTGRARGTVLSVIFRAKRKVRTMLEEASTTFASVRRPGRRNRIARHFLFRIVEQFVHSRLGAAVSYRSRTDRPIARISSRAQRRDDATPRITRLAVVPGGGRELL